MQQDHAESKAEEKSAGAPGRGKASSDKTSQARAVLSLQNTAGNQAMARILGSPAGGATVQRTASAAVSVQRDEWTDALRKELGSKRVRRVIDFEALAKTLVRAHEESAGGKPEAVTAQSKEVSGTKTKKLTSEKLKSRSKKPIDEASVARKREELAELGKRGGPSKLELENEELDRQLKALKAERTESDALREREAGLGHQPSAGEKANATKKAELDRVQKRQEIAELERKMSGLTDGEREERDLDDQLEELKKKQAEAEALRKWERQRKPLNPGKKSLSELMNPGGKSLREQAKSGTRVWRG